MPAPPPEGPVRAPDPRHLRTLDRDLGRVAMLEQVAVSAGRPVLGLGIALIFIALAALLAAIVFGQADNRLAVIIAAGFGAYMALNIGANDVANNMGPAVGAKALSMAGAIAIAAVFESAGALIAGGDVVTTIAQGIVPPHAMPSSVVFVQAMLAALLAAALWVNTATLMGAPVSTTHAIVGGVMGAGMSAAGVAAVHWATLATIAASWVISPLMGGVFAAAILWFVKTRITYRPDRFAAARIWVPVLVGVMGGAFAAYLSLKALAHLVPIGMGRALGIGVLTGGVLWLATIPAIRAEADRLETRGKSMKTLFRLPLIVSAALLSFAHGANDVANAVGPLAAIVDALGTGAFTDAAGIALWVMLIGAFGISFGLVLFGPRLIRIVGKQITRLNPMRAYCVALSAAVTVIVASGFGLPVSSTHIAVGGVFGVGFFREWEAERLRAGRFARRLPLVASEERRRRKLVRRSHFITIAAAWVVTVPAAAVASALIFLCIRAISG